MGGFLQGFKRSVKTWYLRRHLSRRFHAYCIGAAKTGTHSIASLFASRYRTAHEPQLLALIEAGKYFGDPVPDNAATRRYLRDRDARLGLEMEATHVLGFFVAPLASEFPDARFIVTVREPHHWLESVLNDQLRMMRAKGGERWMPVYEYCFGRYAGKAVAAEGALQGLGLYSLDGYLRYWSQHYMHVLNCVPAERRLLLCTHKLAEELSRIAGFLGFPAEDLDPVNAHAYAAPGKESLLSQVNPGYIRDLIEAHCGQMQKEMDLQLGN
jgi:hypothetical protein